MKHLARWVFCLLLPLAVGPAPSGAAEGWPELAAPARSVGGGEGDAAVVVGIERYLAIPGIPGAGSNARAWYDYLTRTRGASAANVALLLDNDAAREDMLEAARKAAARVGSDGTLWFVFIGHGAPGGDGKDGVLVGVDAQQKAESLQARSLKRGELLQSLAASRAGKIAVVLDACFSGRGADGIALAPGLQPLLAVRDPGKPDPRTVVLTAARGDQFAGGLPGASRPAFSYLVLGGLRGWAGTDRVTAGELRRYATKALDATLRGRRQTPDLVGSDQTVLGRSPGERSPDLAAIAMATAGGGGFHVTALPAMPSAEAPAALGAGAAGGLDLGNVDVEGLVAYNAAYDFDKGDAAPAQKAASWRQLGQRAPGFADLAAGRAAAWDRFAAQQQAAEEVRARRAAARDADWDKLRQLLGLGVVPAADKKRWAAEFVAAYGKSPGVLPAMALALAPQLAPGREQAALLELGRNWVWIPAGTFTMGSTMDERERGLFETQHYVTLTRGFYLQATEVTQGQWKAQMGSNPSRFASCGDGCPVEGVTWWEAAAYANAKSASVGLPACYSLTGCRGAAGSGMQCSGVTVTGTGGIPYACTGYRLPTEAEWEYAYRAGTTTAFYSGPITQTGYDPVDPKLDLIGWYWGNSDVTYQGGYSRGGRTLGTHWVGEKQANGWGLYDMAGNVAEWTGDWYGPYPSGAGTDSTGPQSGSARVFRGGHWGVDARGARGAYRGYGAPDHHGSDVGFRLARSRP